MYEVGTLLGEVIRNSEEKGTPKILSWSCITLLGK